jgi:hypothetical protein
MTTIRQVQTKKVTLQTIMSRKSFMRGFNEVKKGASMDYDAFNDNVNDRWRYERGRIFGLLYNGPLKNGQTVLREAQLAYNEAFKSGVLL